MAAKNTLLAVAVEPDDYEQLEMELPLSDQYAIRLHAEQIRLACKAYCKGQLVKVAGELDAIFEPLGHPVSESTLRVALDGTERNYWRGEWLPYFARRCPEVAALMASAGPAPLTAEQTVSLMDQLGPVFFGASYKTFRSKLRGPGK